MKQILSLRLEFAQSQKPSKSQKRKQAKKLQDAEREARIASEKEQLGTHIARLYTGLRF